MATELQQSKVKDLPWKAGATRSKAAERNLLYLRPLPRDLTRVLPREKSGWLYTLFGLTLGVILGYVQFRYRLWSTSASLWNGLVMELALPGVLGAGLGALFSWFHTQRRLTQALITAEVLRRRLLSVERNQALWISLSAVLHDVRNPLHNVSLLSESLGAPGVDVAQVKTQLMEQLERIQTRMRRVMKQVAECSGEIQRHPIRLEEVLDEVGNMIAPLAKQAAVVFNSSCPADVEVVADGRFLVQAIDHLALNSLQILAEQRGDQARRLTLSVAQDESGVSLLVQDSGPGLPAAVRTRLFEPVSASQPAGMGLGLAIAHALASAAGGELSLARTDATGTEFILRLERS